MLGLKSESPSFCLFSLPNKGFLPVVAAIAAACCCCCWCRCCRCCCMLAVDEAPMGCCWLPPPPPPPITPEALACVAATACCIRFIMFCCLPLLAPARLGGGWLNEVGVIDLFPTKFEPAAGDSLDCACDDWGIL